MTKLHLTSVKVLKDLYKEFKYEALKNDQTLQKVVNRSLYKYVTDSVYREQIDEEVIYDFYERRLDKSKSVTL